MAKIVAVDDESMTLDLITACLDRHEVTTASGVDEGLAAVKAARPDLVIVDYHMPGKDGTELVRDIRADAILKGTRIMMLTGDSRMQKVEESFGLGADDYLVKPFSSAVLRARVDALLAKPRA
ncbi:MAG: response regulator transcription factor [Candidatus Coatesbacteria bacterium]